MGWLVGGFEANRKDWTHLSVVVGCLFSSTTLSISSSSSKLVSSGGGGGSDMGPEDVIDGGGIGGGGVGGGGVA